jgi:hypothetical protein
MIAVTTIVRICQELQEDDDFDPANDSECGRRTDGWTDGGELNLTRVLVGLTSPALSLLLVTVYTNLYRVELVGRNWDVNVAVFRDHPMLMAVSLLISPLHPFIPRGCIQTALLFN